MRATPRATGTSASGRHLEQVGQGQRRHVRIRLMICQPAAGLEVEDDELDDVVDASERGQCRPSSLAHPEPGLGKLLDRVAHQACLTSGEPAWAASQSSRNWRMPLSVSG